MVLKTANSDWCVVVPDMPHFSSSEQAQVINMSIAATRINCTIQDAIEDFEHLALWRLCKRKGVVV